MRERMSAVVICATLLAGSPCSAQSAEADARKNYVELAPLGGVTFTSAGDSAGGGVGVSLGYARRISSRVALGPGVSFYLGLPTFRPTTGGALLARVIAGDLQPRGLALLAEVGGSYFGGARWFIQADVGVLAWGFVVKAGYLLSTGGATHTVLFALGYTLGW